MDAKADRFCLKTVSLSVLLWLTVSADAGVLVNNGPLDPRTEQPTSVNGTLEAADRFTISNYVSIRYVRFFGLYARDGSVRPEAPDDFFVRIFADTNGSPADAPLAEFHVGRAHRRFFRQVRVEAEPASFVLRYYRYAAHLPRRKLQLGPGTYWLSIANDMHGMGDWGIGAKVPGTGDLHFRDSFGLDFPNFSPWFDSVPGYGIAFKLLGSKLQVCPK